jgi:hypothetical protein
MERVVSGEKRSELSNNLRLIAGLDEVNSKIASCTVILHIDFEVKKIPRILSSPFLVRDEAPHIRYTGRIRILILWLPHV